MKSTLLRFAFLLLASLSLSVYAQAPQGVHYQAVARNGTSLVTNASVSIQFTISAGGIATYQERHNTATNAYGLFNLVIGTGTPVFGQFAGIDWGNGNHHLKVEVDVGTGFFDMGTSPLQSVPYSLYAETVDMDLADLNDVDASLPATGEVLAWNGFSWMPTPDQAGPAYLAGTGIDLTSNTITNTGDLDPADDITIGASAGGDLSGTYPDPQVIALQGSAVSANAPQQDQILKWNGQAWVPAADEFIDGDSDAGNELQSLAISGNTISLSNGGGSVSIPVYTGGTGINVAGTLITNTGDTNAADDITVTSQAAGDVDGPFSALNVGRIQGQPIANLAPANDQVLKWDGIQWKAAVDENDIPKWEEINNHVFYATGRVGVGTSQPRTAFHVATGKTVLFGADTISNGVKMLWSPVRGAMRVGGLSSTLAGTFWNPDSLGFYSFAAGLDTRATGYGSTALGRDTEASKLYAFATGYFTDAKADYATAMGYNTDAIGIASVAMNYETLASGSYSFAAGRSTQATGNYAFATGQSTQATGRYSATFGFQTKAQTYLATAFGRYNVGGGNATSWIGTDPLFEVGIGTNAFNTANALTILKNGKVGIGVAFPEDELHVNGVVRIGSLETIQDGGGFILNVNAALAPSSNGGYNLGSSFYRWSTVYAMNGTINTSDRREKNSIQDLQYGLNEVMQLRPVSFQWKEHPEQGEKLGLIAQEVQSLLPETVKATEWQRSEETGELSEVEADRLGIYYSDLIPVLIKAVQEQQAEIESLKERLSAVEQK